MITNSDTNTAICGCFRGYARHFGDCAQQKSTFAGHNLQNAVPTTSITAIFLTNRAIPVRRDLNFELNLDTNSAMKKTTITSSEF